MQIFNLSIIMQIFLFNFFSPFFQPSLHPMKNFPAPKESLVTLMAKFIHVQLVKQIVMQIWESLWDKQNCNDLTVKIDFFF